MLPSVDLVWQAPEGCPDQAQEVAEIARLAGSGGERTGVSVRAVVTRGQQGFTVHLTSAADGETRERTVDAPTCKEAAAAAALIVAMSLASRSEPAAKDGDAAGKTTKSTENEGSPGTPFNGAAPHDTASSSERTEDGAASRPANTAPPESTPAAPEKPTAPETRRVRGEARATFAFDAAALPSPAPGAGAALALLAGLFRLDVRGALFPEQRRALAGGGGADIGLATAGLDAWLVPLVRPLELFAGVGLEGGAQWGRGFGAAGAHTAAAPWLAARAGVGVAYPFIPRFGATLTAHLVVPILQEQFLLGPEQVFRPAPVTLRMEVGPFFRFP